MQSLWPWQTHGRHSREASLRLLFRAALVRLAKEGVIDFQGTSQLGGKKASAPLVTHSLSVPHSGLCESNLYRTRGG